MLPSGLERLFYVCEPFGEQTRNSPASVAREPVFLPAEPLRIALIRQLAEWAVFCTQIGRRTCANILNMFYLIGGTPRSGKTILTKNLAKELGISWVSTDTLESVVRAYSSTEELSNFFPKTAIRKETQGNNDFMYERYSAREITDAYIKQAKATWKAVEVFLEAEDVNGHSYILEGYQINPELVEKLTKKFPSQIKGVFLGRENTETIVQAARDHTSKGDWFTGKTHKEETFPKIAEMIAMYSDYFKTQAYERGLPYFNMDLDFQGQLKLATSELLGLGK